MSSTISFKNKTVPKNKPSALSVFPRAAPSWNDDHVIKFGRSLRASPASGRVAIGARSRVSSRRIRADFACGRVSGVSNLLADDRSTRSVESCDRVSSAYLSGGRMYALRFALRPAGAAPVGRIRFSTRMFPRTSPAFARPSSASKASLFGVEKNLSVVRRGINRDESRSPTNSRARRCAALVPPCLRTSRFSRYPRRVISRNFHNRAHGE